MLSFALFCIVFLHVSKLRQRHEKLAKILFGLFVSTTILGLFRVSGYSFMGVLSLLVFLLVICQRCVRIAFSIRLIVLFMLNLWCLMLLVDDQMLNIPSSVLFWTIELLFLIITGWLILNTRRVAREVIENNSPLRSLTGMVMSLLAMLSLLLLPFLIYGY